MFSCVLVFMSAFVALSRCQFDKEIGDACRNNGTCKLLNDCPFEEKLLQQNSDAVETCGFDENSSVIVCCNEQRPTPPPFKLVRNGDISISEKKCEEYAEYVYTIEPSLTLAATGNKVSQCAKNVEELINGGKPARPKEFPHMAEIGYGRAPTVSYECGGSLISERWVMSAAHCSDVEKLGRPRLARIGDLDNTNKDDGARPVIINIVKVVDHPDYKKGKMYDDIALFKLEKDAPLSPFIRPVCLQVNHRIGIENAIAIGFGHLNFGGEYHHFLQKVDLNIVDSKKCNKAHGEGSYAGLSNGIVDSKMLCAGDEEGKDTCKGDSGSSLLVKLVRPYCMFSQVGITSFGRNCGQGYPGVYTRVSHYVPWIEEIVWPEENKKKHDGQIAFPSP